MPDRSDAEIRIFSTAPQSSRVRRGLLQRVRDVARWSEEGGCTGILVYTDNSLVDPWLVSEVIIAATNRLAPLVAVQPVYMHPYSVAKMVSTLGFLHGRSVYLNMVAGGFVGDLRALDDHTQHDARYERLVEYTLLVRRLLAGEVVTAVGNHYTVDRLRMNPPLDPSLQPPVFVSGSSRAGLAAARALGATAIQYPKPAEEYIGAIDEVPPDAGIRIGIIARDDPAEAWRVAWERFPVERRGRLLHELAMKVSDSTWHRQLGQLARESSEGASSYWLHPFENYQTFCPYLVGGYDQIAVALSEYIGAGFRTFILDIPTDAEDIRHTRIAFGRAQSREVVNVP